MNSSQHMRLLPTVQRVMGSPTTISHSRARVMAVLNSWGGERGGGGERGERGEGRGERVSDDRPHTHHNYKH